MGALEEYYKIINFRLENPLQKGTYGEKHHIKPKSIYPELENDPNNIVKLTAEEHYKCHSLLPDIYKELHNEIGYRKMLFAWNYMTVDGKHTIDEQAKEYAKLREEFRKANSGKNHPRYGVHLSESTREKISEAMSGENNPNYGKHCIMSEETREKISKALSGENNPWYGKHLSESTREKLSKAMSGENHPRYGKHLSEETKQKMREAQLGKKRGPYKHSEEYYLKHPDKRK